MSTDNTASARVDIKVWRTADPTMPPLALQITHLVDTYMLWVGVAGGDSVEDGEKAVQQGNLCKDWACAMPPRTTGSAGAATSLFRTSSSDVALSMAQRLAKRFGKQIFLSVDLPLSPGQGELLAFEAEKGIVDALKHM